MQAVQTGRLFGRRRGVQIIEELQDPVKRYYNFAEWVPPEGAVARLAQEAVALALPRDAAFQAHRMFGRFVWPKEAPNHINHGAPEAGTGRVYRFVANVSFPSKRFEGY